MKKKWIYLLAGYLFSTILYAEEAKPTTPKTIAQENLHTFINAINHPDIENPSLHLHPKAVLLLENAQIFHTPNQWHTFIAKPEVAGGDIYIKKVSFKDLHIDDEIIVLDPSTFIVTGSALLDYKEDKQHHYDIPSRWLAVFHQEKNQWQLVSFQNTVDVLENPFLDEIKNRYYLMALITLVLGIIIGFVWKRFRGTKI